MAVRTPGKGLNRTTDTKNTRDKSASIMLLNHIYNMDLICNYPYPISKYQIYWETYLSRFYCNLRQMISKYCCRMFFFVVSSSLLKRLCIIDTLTVVNHNAILFCVPFFLYIYSTWTNNQYSTSTNHWPLTATHHKLQQITPLYYKSPTFKKYKYKSPPTTNPNLPTIKKSPTNHKLSLTINHELPNTLLFLESFSCLLVVIP